MPCHVTQSLHPPPFILLGSLNRVGLGGSKGNSLAFGTRNTFWEIQLTISDMPSIPLLPIANTSTGRTLNLIMNSLYPLAPQAIADLFTQSSRYIPAHSSTTDYLHLEAFYQFISKPLNRRLEVCVFVCSPIRRRSRLGIIPRECHI